jgi:putative PIN family toxin of toxin-antitoxin system
VPNPQRVVLDTNILLRGLINSRSTSGRIVHACDAREFILLLSKPVLAEYRQVLHHPSIVKRYPELAPEKVALALRRLRYVADEQSSIRVSFDFPRDPKDARFIELAIAGRATHLVTADDDLLSLATSHSEAAKRFRQRTQSMSVIEPAVFAELFLR